MTDCIAKKRREKLGEYHANEEMFDKIMEVVCLYNGKVSFPEALGILELVKDEMKENNHD